MKIVVPSRYSLTTCCVKVSKKKNENPIFSELPKISMLLEMLFGHLGVKESKTFFKNYFKIIKCPSSQG